MHTALATLNLTVLRGGILWLLSVSWRCSFIVCTLPSSRGYALYRDDCLAGERASDGIAILVEDTLCTLVRFGYELIYTL